MSADEDEDVKDIKLEPNSDESESSEEDSDNESEIEEQKIVIDYAQDDAILDGDYDVPSTSNVLSMKTVKKMFKKPKKKPKRRRKTNGKKRRKVTRRKTTHKKRRKRKTKRKRTNDDLAKRLRLRWAKKARELTTREKIIETCGIDTKHTNQYKIVMKSKSANALSSMPNALPEKLDLLGTSTFGFHPSNDVDYTQEEENPNVQNTKSQKEEKPIHIQPSVDLLDKILEDQNRTFPVFPTKRTREKKSENENKQKNETTVEREILTRHERRKRMREELKKHGKLENRLKQLMHDKTVADPNAAKQAQHEENSEMETMPMTSRGADISLPDPLAKPPRKTRWQQSNASMPSNNFNNFVQEKMQNEPNLNSSISNNGILFPGLLGAIPQQIPSLQLSTSNQINPAQNFPSVPHSSANSVLDILRNASILPTSLSLLASQLNPQGNATTDLLNLYRQQMQLNPLLLQAQLLQQPSMSSLPLPSLIIPQQLSQQPPPMQMHLPPPPPPPLNNLLLQQQNIRPQEATRLSDLLLPHIPLPNSSPNTSGALDPCPPQSDSRSSGSPMDIDMEIGEESHSRPSTSKNTTANPKDQLKKQKDSRLNDAVTVMKNALKPFYRDKIISKNEYKEIMKKGVDKLIHTKNDALEQKRVDKFAKKYVDLVVHNRKKEKDSRPPPTS